MPSTENIVVSVRIIRLVEEFNNVQKRTLTFRQLIELFRQLGKVRMLQAVFSADAVVWVEL